MWAKKCQCLQTPALSCVPACLHTSIAIALPLLRLSNEAGARNILQCTVVVQLNTCSNYCCMDWPPATQLMSLCTAAQWKPIRQFQAVCLGGNIKGFHIICDMLYMQLSSVYQHLHTAPAHVACTLDSLPVFPKTAYSLFGHCFCWPIQLNLCVLKQHFLPHIK